jgi:AraC family transcriptional regulator
MSEADVSIASSSARVGHLVERAMTFFDSNRAAAWRSAWQAKRTLDYIEANLAAKVGLEEMANMVTLSKSHFSRAFKCSLGSSPMAFVMARRVERAKLMMTSTRERLTDIALACGFSDQSHLNRHFRRVVGTSPGLWRRMSQCEGEVNRR